MFAGCDDLDCGEGFAIHSPTDFTVFAVVSTEGCGVPVPSRTGWTTEYAISDFELSYSHASVDAVRNPRAEISIDVSLPGLRLRNGGYDRSIERRPPCRGPVCETVVLSSLWFRSGQLEKRPG